MLHVAVRQLSLLYLLPFAGPPAVPSPSASLPISKHILPQFPSRTAVMWAADVCFTFAIWVHHHSPCHRVAATLLLSSSSLHTRAHHLINNVCLSSTANPHTIHEACLTWCFIGDFISKGCPAYCILDDCLVSSNGMIPAVLKWSSMHV